MLGKAKIKHSRAILTVTVIVAGIIGSVLISSCQTPQVPPPKLLPPTNKLPPAYTITIGFPYQSDKVSLKQGDSVTLKVMIRSLVDHPISIKPVLVTNIGQLPRFLKYSQPNDGQFVTLAPNASLDTQIAITVSDDAQVGDYKIGIHGQLQEPVEGRSGETMFFDLAVIAK